MIFKKTVILGAICLGSITLMAPSALAVTSVGDSKATIKFIAGTGVVDPVDPTDPTKPLDSVDPSNPTDPGTGNTGALTLDYVSSVAFGEQEISSNEATYSATSRKPFIQVSDRRGTGKGWYVTATASAFQDEYGTNSLAGATLSFQNGEAVSASTTTTSPTASQKVDIPTDGTSVVDVISAEETEGMGTWINRWLGATPDDVDSLNDNVKLVIPAGSATLGDHEATITWTLSDAPGA
ncbi:WxL domain-containing protein [Listeria ivanovii]|uniref:WxL domain-containing protein n=1 Tax=Listeria ivanovii TaxID=1638 RepID=UPI000DAA9AD4|nr:WxL domain-containing protein [Listeria ivanovii]PZF87928.1 WxL domain-containing protein [Listeria ivanovii]PZF93129.1 WxL domain-containing protein [Listeria ivanovii]PZG03995.1 WxL domain-containing protein [Listeria ivanovii]PZG08395.1 WxL domain-containing protein [Listeria ivanovii]PZG25249.1 WxL domain-containing protein [Listeria ivanovii]